MSEKQGSCDRFQRNRPFHIKRRAFNLGMIGLCAVLANPCRSPAGRYYWIKPAEAFVWIPIAMLALSVISAFSKRSDGGVSDYLQNIQTLTQENILLTQEVLARVADLQAQVDQLPEKMREVFIEVQSYQLRQNTQQIWDMLQLIEKRRNANGKLNDQDRRDCQTIIQISGSMTAARAVPSGRGGVAAACAPLIGAIEARASYFLGQTTDFRRRVSIEYLPWFDSMLADQDGSVERAFQQSGRDLATAAGNGLDGLPDGLKNALLDSWKNAQAVDPGQVTSSVRLACGGYSRQVGTKQGGCSRQQCGTHPTSVDPTVQSIIDASKMPQYESRELLRIQGETIQPEMQIECHCVARSTVPVYNIEAGAALSANFLNEVTPGNPPQMQFISNWGSLGDASSCPSFVNGLVSDPAQQFAAARDSADAQQINQQLAAWQTGQLASFNDQRAIVFATYQLLDAARGAREQFKRVAI